MKAADRALRKSAGVQDGFTLLELAVVLVVIGLIIGAVTIGRDLQRNASYQQVSASFVQAWRVAYDAYVDGQGIVPGDDPSSPTGQVNQGERLCGDELMNAFLAAGISLPAGRAEGQHDRYVYHDSNGNPQQVRVCFEHVDWAEPGSSLGEYQLGARNVMRLEGLTPALAELIDRQVDGRVNARFGSFRESGLADSLDPDDSEQWSLDERDGTSGSNVGGNEYQVAVLTAYFAMPR
ncbi:prepilin-type N-terminal cleavage/methylation domain-containing protein [Wenzhouxiangella sp. AB-CW3]|uniref:prepilin-type N-terminal cleavage/methylation domain-containing protein n=1 Tax=Wenzhouxiangella sp. AB-CW3 TaxID=2771012 RepID=UPI00168B64ED|nr:prepilin-type N-terminal cleavage/methylation domain-containing protein [Wenzhouxiangella sp. AB-CW3]QOC22169.1 prepilin-type N-terminal cleavage/methylation domain-containing protein [Wenzhouxiangella sp. AB-CW3]